MTDLTYRGFKVAKSKENTTKVGILQYRGQQYHKTVRSTQPGNRVFLYRGNTWVG